MAVLCEAISVVIRCDLAVDRLGRLETLSHLAPNDTYCSDGEIARVGFMTPADVEAFSRTLEKRGLHYLIEGQAKDFVVVDQIRGCLAPVDWLHFGHLLIEGQRIAAARRAGSEISRVFVPAGWSFEGSLSQSFGFAPTDEVDKSLKFLRSEGGLDVYYNLVTGKEVYIGRAESGAGV